MDQNILNRKNDHIRLAIQDQFDLYSSQLNGFDKFKLEHLATPEIDFEEVSTECTLLGKKLTAPIIIGAMTGGTDLAGEINTKLAKAASEKGIAMALGSQRALLQDKNTLKSFDVRAQTNQLPLLIGNIGAVQLNNGIYADHIKELINLTKLDAIYLHLNPLQEVLQPEGNTNFKGLLTKIQDLILDLKSSGFSTPIIIKEIGSGLSNTAALKLASLGADGVEVAGVGGTSWAKIEGARNTSESLKTIAENFSSWGTSTADSLVHAKQYFTDRVIISSGGIRNGIEIAKSIALGANACSIARPFVVAANTSYESIINLIDQLVLELKISMFLTGSKNLQELQKKGVINRV